LESALKADQTKLIAAKEKLGQLIPPDANLWCAPQTVVEIGDPALQVQSYAEKERPDLIVLGLPRNKEFSAHFRTGVTYKLLISAPCPVLTVRDLTIN